RSPGYFGPGPLIGPSTVGTGGTTKSACAAAIINSRAAPAHAIFLLTGIARCLADVAGAVVAQRLGIRTQRPAARGIRQAGVWADRRREAVAGRDDLLRRDAAIHKAPPIASSACWNVRIGVARRRIRQAVGIERIGPLFLELGDEVHAHCFLGLQAASAVPARHE